MREKGIKILPYRIIPCDFGHRVDTEIFENIVTDLEKSGEWVVLSKSEDLAEGEILSAKLGVNESKVSLYLHLYLDGVGIFTIVDEEEEYANHKVYETERTLLARKCAHRDVLTHKNQLSEVMDKLISNIRSRFDKNITRISASSIWENMGLSYVMSFYFIEVATEIIENSEFHEKLVFLLFPYYDEQHDTNYSKEANLEEKFAKEKFRENFLTVVKKDCDILPYIHTCASWSNLLIIGRTTEEIKNDYWKLERDLQHCWFYTYITDKFIEHSLKNLSTAMPERELEVLDNILTEMLFKINQYEGIISSTTSERYFKLYEALRTTSRLNLLIKSVEKKAKLLKDRYNWLSEEKRKKTDKKIQFILFLIAIISAVEAYESFEKLGGLYSILLAALSIAFGIYVFKPILWKQENRERQKRV